MKTTTSRTFALLSVCAMIVAIPLVAQSAQTETPDPKTILRKMSTYVAAQKTVAFRFDSDIEIITPQLEKIQFASSGEVVAQRPDKLHAHRKGGFADVDLIFDGKTVSIYGRGMNGYTQFEVPGTLDKVIDSLREGYGVALPGADLIATNAYDTLIADVLESKYLGQGVVDGVECDHLAFRNFETDWQLWVEAGDKPIPRKMVITSKTINGAPQHTVRITQWKTDEKPAANAFVFTAPPDAKKLEPNSLIDLDELPRGSVPGGRK